MSKTPLEVARKVTLRDKGSVLSSRCHANCACAGADHNKAMAATIKHTVLFIIIQITFSPFLGCPV
jgi:hypothetical protein